MKLRGRRLFKFIRKRLSRTVLSVLTVSVTVVMIVVIYMTASNQTKIMVAEMERSAEDLAHTIYASIKHPMSVGDSASIEKELLDMREERKGVEVFICDFDHEIIYATHKEKLKTNITNYIINKDALLALTNIVKKGEHQQTFFEEKTPDGRYLIHVHHILNQKECYHCHGSFRKVLGSMVIRMNTEQTHAAIASARNRTILMSIFGMCAIIALTYSMLNKLVRRPVESLAKRAKRLAEGDLSVSVDVKTEDEIGVLGTTFNYMVRSVKDQKEYATSLRTTIINRTGENIPIMVSASFLRDSTGKLLGGLEIFQDITAVLDAERLKYIEKTADREEKQRKYLEERVKSISEVLSLVSEGNLNVRTEVLEMNDAMDK